MQNNNQTILQKFGMHLKQHRIKKELSQELLAHMSGLHRTYIGDLENGKRNPSFQTLIKLSSALEIDLSDFFHGFSYES